ncbi:PREDICTED: NDR1/HIN1-like protein 12 [Camelina sativa]|uniref:NDR1/HIN1-like protein 12 n=1 Tax=Camelina sativa TaxID=90675 RepID=A0ABM0WQ39_CAMSA|nr:PREDICTED: NDR1/HIN1-like protein 12 [Camelina sativa]
MMKEDATGKKNEPTNKKEGAKEEGAAPKHIRVAYSDKRRTKIIYVVSGLAVLLVTCVLAVVFSLVAIQPRVPRFVLEDLYVDDDHLSNSSVIVKLSSTNPSYKTSVYYSNMNLHMRVRKFFDYETESVSLESKLQEPREDVTWTAVVANDNDNVRPIGAFKGRDGKADGDVIADMKIQWKSKIFRSPKFGLRVTCSVLVRLKDLSSADTKLKSACSHHLI